MPRSPSGSTICSKAFGLPLDVPEVSHDELIELMYRDKKVERGKLRFVLPSRLGHVEVVRGVDTTTSSWPSARTDNPAARRRVAVELSTTKRVDGEGVFVEADARRPVLSPFRPDHEVLEQVEVHADVTS